MSEIIDRPWAIVYGPRCKLGKGLLYGLGNTKKDAWRNAVLVYRGRDEGPLSMRNDEIELKKLGMVARRVTILSEA